MAKRKTIKKPKQKPDQHPNVSAKRREQLKRMSMQDIETGIDCGDITEDERNWILGI